MATENGVGDAGRNIFDDFAEIVTHPDSENEDMIAGWHGDDNDDETSQAEPPNTPIASEFQPQHWLLGDVADTGPDRVEAFQFTGMSELNIHMPADDPDGLKMQTFMDYLVPGDFFYQMAEETNRLVMFQKQIYACTD